MSPELQERIIALKPEWFRNLINGVECRDGWYDLLVDLIGKLLKLEEEEPDTFESFAVVQIKQKFGELRFYVEGDPENGMRRIHSLIGAYEYRSLSICEICGKPAKVQTMNYIQSLCRYPHDDRETA